MANNPYLPQNEGDDVPFDAPGIPTAQPAAALPEWAQIRADLPDDDAAPAPQTPAPQAPAPAAAPPARPVRRPTPPAPPAPAHPAPQPEPEVYEPPAPPRQKPVVVEPEPEIYSEPEPYVPTRARATPPRQFDNPPSAPTAPSRRASSARAGGRWKLLAVRGAVWGALGLIFLLGAMRLINPSPVSVDSVTEKVAAALGRNAFPAEVGQQVAQRFARIYLNYSADSASERSDQLKAYLATGTTTLDWTYAGSEDKNYFTKIASGPFIAAAPDLVDDNHVTYTFSALINDPTTGTKNGSETIPPRWVYLEVPMVSDEAGHVAVAGAPAFVAAPPLATKVEVLGYKSDKNATADAEDTIAGYFKDWAQATAAKPVQEVYLRAGESTEAAATGLAGSVAFASLASFDVAEQADPSATIWDAYATVNWMSPGGVKLVQSYRLTITNVDSHWFVLDIRGGSFS